MKKSFSIILVLLLCAVLIVPSFAADIARFTDGALLLTEEENQALNAKLDEMSERLQFDIAVVTLESLNGYNAEQAAETIWDQYGFGYGEYSDGVILLISMEERDWAITSTGWGQDYIGSYEREFISNTILNDLSTGDYYSAFTDYADLCEQCVTAGREAAENAEDYGYDDYGYGYDDYSYGYDDYSYEYRKPPFNAGLKIIIAVVIGLIVGAIATGSMKSKLKSVKMQTAAANYVVDNSLKFSEANERFLYHTITRTPRPQNVARTNNGGMSHSGGGGISHSGHSSSSGKF